MNKEKDNKVKVNLKGIAVGNGVTDTDKTLKFKAKLDFAWGH